MKIGDPGCRRSVKMKMKSGSERRELHTQVVGVGDPGCTQEKSCSRRRRCCQVTASTAAAVSQARVFHQRNNEEEAAAGPGPATGILPRSCLRAGGLPRSPAPEQHLQGENKTEALKQKPK